VVAPTLGRSRMESEMAAELRFSRGGVCRGIWRAKGYTRGSDATGAAGVWGDRARQEEAARRACEMDRKSGARLRYGPAHAAQNLGFTAVTVLHTRARHWGERGNLGLVAPRSCVAYLSANAERLVHIWTMRRRRNAHAHSEPVSDQCGKESESFEQIAGGRWADYFYEADGSSCKTCGDFW